MKVPLLINAICILVSFIGMFLIMSAPRAIPTRITTLDTLQVCAIACGEYSSAALTSMWPNQIIVVYNNDRSERKVIYVGTEQYGTTWVK